MATKKAVGSNSGPGYLGMLKDSDDLVYGQSVIVISRWILVAAGLLLALWNPGEIGELRIQIMVLLVLAVANFYLQAQLLMKRQAIDLVVYGASAGDLAVITILVIALGGFGSSVYIFYFPAILAFSVAFPTILTILFVGGVSFFYAMISLASMSLVSGDLQVILVRILMLVAVAVCGNLYRRIERNRRQAAAQAQEELTAQLRQRQVAQPAQ